MWFINEFDFVVNMDRCCLKWYLDIHAWNICISLYLFTLSKSILKSLRIIVGHANGILQSNCSKILIKERIKVTWD